MQIWLKNVPQPWVQVVETLASPDELAIWQASGDRAWRAAQPGDLVLFRPEGRSRVVIGHGLYVGTTLHFARDAHALFGAGLGVHDLGDLRTQIDARRAKPAGPNPVIAITLFRDLHLFPMGGAFELPWPHDAADVLVPLCSKASTPAAGTFWQGSTIMRVQALATTSRGSRGCAAPDANVPEDLRAVPDGRPSAA